MNRPTLIFLRWFDASRAPLALQGLTILVVISVAAVAAGVFWRIVGLDDGRDRIALAEPTTTASATTDLAPILAWAPFGGAASAVQASASGLVLKAIFLMVPAEASSALIAIGDAPAVAVHPGQTLSSGAIVQSIAVDHVLLQVGAQSERLTFPGPALALDSQPTVVTSVPTQPTTLTPMTMPQPLPSGGTSVGPASNSGVIPSVVEQYRRNLDGNASGVARDLGVTATTLGYRVGNDLSPALRSAGLQPGDVVSRVNNQPVGADANPRAILDQAITSGGARVDVVRNGRTVTLSFPLR